MSEQTVKTYPTTSVNLELMYPFEVGGTKLTHLTFRRPKVRDQLIASKTKDAQGNKLDSLDVEIGFTALLTEQERTTIESLDAADYSEVQQILLNFQKTKEELTKELSKED